MVKSKSTGRTKKPRRKKLSLYLLNDSVNSYEHVIDVLTTLIPLCNKLRAEQLAMLTHNVGECEIYRGFQPEIFILYAQFQKARLKVQLRDYNTK
jgi:ATP-dependent Clp protease adapter protein ClpS|tara:strand:- start:1072 stop:1356 length:285 start_codon:yes stop_codon:yes gene_type:complete